MVGILGAVRVAVVGRCRAVPGRRASTPVSPGNAPDVQASVSRQEHDAGLGPHGRFATDAGDERAHHMPDRRRHRAGSSNDTTASKEPAGDREHHGPLATLLGINDRPLRPWPMRYAPDAYRQQRPVHGGLPRQLPLHTDRSLTCGTYGSWKLSPESAQHLEPYGLRWRC